MGKNIELLDVVVLPRTCWSVGYGVAKSARSLNCLVRNTFEVEFSDDEGRSSLRRSLFKSKATGG